MQDLYDYDDEAVFIIGNGDTFAVDPFEDLHTEEMIDRFLEA